MNFFYYQLIWMQLQFQISLQKVIQHRNQLFQSLLFHIQNDKIVGIPQIIFGSQIPFYELVEPIKIDVGENLTG